jgi:hypothetical protein
VIPGERLCLAARRRDDMQRHGQLRRRRRADLSSLRLRRNRAWRAWQQAGGLVLRPQFGRSGRAWTMGLTLQF